MMFPIRENTLVFILTTPQPVLHIYIMNFKIIFWILNILNRLSFPKRRNRTAFILETYACTQLHSNAFKEIRYYGVFPSFKNTTNRVNDSCSTYNFLKFYLKGDSSLIQYIPAIIFPPSTPLSSSLDQIHPHPVSFKIEQALFKIYSSRLLKYTNLSGHSGKEAAKCL